MKKIYVISGPKIHRKPLLSKLCKTDFRFLKKSLSKNHGWRVQNPHSGRVNFFSDTLGMDMYWVKFSKKKSVPYCDEKKSSDVSVQFSPSRQLSMVLEKWFIQIKFFPVIFKKNFRNFIVGKESIEARKRYILKEENIDFFHENPLDGSISTHLFRWNR